MATYRDKLQQHFEEEYQKLNSNQQLAVNSLEGPVMVIAGPGTGKTQILAARIGKILLDTDAAPDNILCLTYTDAGTIAMRKRLLSFIGPDAYKVHLYTFHGFCNEIIQENLSLFEKTSLDPISELERIQLARKLIDQFPKNHPLKRYRGDVYYEINNLLKLFSVMKREGMTPQFINQKISEHLEQIKEDEEYKYKNSRKGSWEKGTLKPSYHDEVERMEKLNAAVNEFDHYQAMMREINRYDFDDMINWVIHALETNKNLLAQYQEKYQYILVDEYQDTSGTQNQLVRLLISYWERPNIFVVGDDDQSIYRFQGANVENMLEFSSQFSQDLLTVVLADNYRSTQPILDISKTLIDHNEERLIKKIDGLKKDLKAGNVKISQFSYPPEIAAYQTPKLEMTGITLEIEKLLAQGTAAGSIAVIYRENKYGEELAKFFRQKNIPVYSKRSLNLFEIPFARKLLLILEYLAAEHDVPYGGDEMLFEILHFDFYRIPPIVIAKLSVEVAEKQFGENKTSLRRLISEKINQPPKDLFDPGMPAGLIKAGNSLEKLIGEVPNVTLQTLFEKIIREGGILQYIMLSPEKIWLMQVLTGIFDFIKEETQRNPAMTLEELVLAVQLMENNGLPIPLVQVSGTEKGVNLLTAHGAKGLEFAYVFFAGCNAPYWEKKRKPGGGYKYPRTLLNTPTKKNEEEELRRLFYVALTRAQVHLRISYSLYRMDGKEQEPSMFVAEIQDVHHLPVVEKLISDSDIAEFDIAQFSEAAAPEIAKLEEEFVSRQLEKFVMNVTALNNYLKCPLEFYFRNLLRIPSPKNEATEFGSAVHYALQSLFEKMKANSEQFPPLSVFIGDFEWYMHRHRESFTKEQFNRRLEYGHEVLTHYYTKYVTLWNKIVVVERNIRNVVINGVPIKGKLDKLEFNGKEVNVVDYKTGDPDKAKDKLKAPTDKIPNGGDYWRQAVFYKILVDHYGQKDWKATSTEFDFVEPDKKKEYRKTKIVIAPQDIETVSGQITQTWQKIQDRDFYTGCGDPDCHWCSFVKTNNMAVALHELNLEEEEENS
jgi:DNA helicase-2/ATP-dependent DNA helicase PcrA